MTITANNVPFSLDIRNVPTDGNHRFPVPVPGIAGDRAVGTSHPSDLLPTHEVETVLERFFDYARDWPPSHAVNLRNQALSFGEGSVRLRLIAVHWNAVEWREVIAFADAWKRYVARSPARNWCAWNVFLRKGGLAPAQFELTGSTVLSAEGPSNGSYSDIDADALSKAIEDEFNADISAANSTLTTSEDPVSVS